MFYFLLWILTETFTLDEALEAIGFGKFQWKISLLTGLSWVRQLTTHTMFFVLILLLNTVRLSCCALPLSADSRCHGDDDSQHLGPPAALRVETAQLYGCSHHIGMVPLVFYTFLTLQFVQTMAYLTQRLYFFDLRLCLSGQGSVHLYGARCLTSMAGKW